MAEELRRQAAEPTEQAHAAFNVLEQLNPASGQDPEPRAVELSVFENRVGEAVEAARSEGEQVEHHPNASLGEPLAHAYVDVLGE